MTCGIPIVTPRRSKDVWAPGRYTVEDRIREAGVSEVHRAEV